MRQLNIGASCLTATVSQKRTFTFRRALLFIAILPAVSAQGVSVDINVNVTVFSDSGQLFERICRYVGPSSQLDHLEWLLNGTVYIDGDSGVEDLQLLIRPSITFSHAGKWECRAILSDDATPIVVAAGTVTVLDPNDINAPHQQYALAGQNYTLVCNTSLANNFISLERNGVRTSHTLTVYSVQLNDEGVYYCRVSVRGASLEKTVQLTVIVPPKILSFPQYDNQPFGNEQVTLTVAFQSNRENFTTVGWFKDDIRIDPSNITTLYTAPPNATTELRFQQITRKNRGSYRVVIENTARLIPVEMRTAVATFEVDVQVPPSRPTGVTAVNINDTHVRIRWTLTNQTADAGAEVLTLHLQDHPNSPFRLKPDQVEWILGSEPGMMYNLSLKATNPDGTATTDPMTVKLPATAPSVKTFRALRVNNTAFNFTLEVFYTGGGDIMQFSIRQFMSGTFEPRTTVTPVQSKTLPRLWYAVVTSPTFDDPEDPRFDVNVLNAMGQSVVKEVQGEVVIPGPPTIFLVSASSDSLAIQIEVSNIGTAPIQAVEMNVTFGSQGQLLDTIERSGSFIQGELIDVIVTGLQPSTEYTFRSRAMNAHGTGAVSMEFVFTTGEPTTSILPPWAIIVISVGGSVILTVLCVTVILCLVCCCKRSCCRRDYTEKYCPSGVSIGAVPQEIKTSAETLNSTSHRGSVRGGVVGNYTSVPLTPRSPTIESYDSPYIKQRFESVTDSDGSRSDVQVHQPYYRHYTYSHSPGPVGSIPPPLTLHHGDHLSHSLTAFDEQVSPQDILHQATMV